MQKRSEETRTHIILAAIDLFSKYGYNLTGVAEICTAAGVSKGAFYHHFSSKQSVFLAIFSAWMDRLDFEIQNSRNSAASIPEAIDKMLGLLEGVFLQAGGYLPMFLEFWSQASHDSLVWQVVIEPYQHYRSYFMSMIQDGINEGTIRPVDPQVTASTLVSLALGFLLQGLIDPKGLDWGGVTRNSVTLYLESLYTVSTQI
jgi:AcrR family transcriptional regulator